MSPNVQRTQRMSYINIMIRPQKKVDILKLRPIPFLGQLFFAESTLSWVYQKSFKAFIFLSKCVLNNIIEQKLLKKQMS